MLAVPRTAPFLLHGSLAVHTMALGVIVALMAEIQDSQHLPNSSLGLIAAAGALSAFLTYWCLARFADRGYAKAMLVGGVVLSACALFVFAFSAGLGALVLAKALLGAAGGIFVPAARSVAIGWRPANPGETLGGLTAATVGGFALGPIVGTVLADRFGLSISLVGTGIALMVLGPLLKRMSVPTTSRPMNRIRTRYLLTNRLVLAGIALGSVDFATVAVSDALWARVLTDQGATVVFLGTTYSLALGSTVLFAPRFGRLADRKSPALVAKLGLLFVVVGMLGYGLMGRPVFLAMAALCHAIGCAALAPVAAALVVRGSRGAIGHGQGILRSSAYLAAAIFALPSGWAYDSLGRPVWFVSLSLVAIALTVLAAKLMSGEDAMPHDAWTVQFVDPEG